MIDDFFEKITLYDNRALAAKAKAGVRVRVVYDWLGSYGSVALWQPLRDAGALDSASARYMRASRIAQDSTEGTEARRR